MACDTCRVKKIKCDKIKPTCGRCELRSLPCHYASERRQSRKLDASEIEKRLLQMETVFRHMNEVSATITVERNSSEDSELIEPTQTTQTSGATSSESLQHIGNPEADADMEFIWSVNESSSTPLEVISDVTPVSNAQGSGLSPKITSRDDKLSSHDSLLNQLLAWPPVAPPVENNAAVWIRTLGGDEYTGPSSGISLLSDPGLAWIGSTFTGSEDVCIALKSVTLDVASHLQVPKCILSRPWSSISLNWPQKALPTEEVAWTYVEAYFARVQCVFPILDRHSFESRLYAYFRDPNDSELAWIALLNAVLASGSRALLSAETPTAFKHSGTEGWAYYQNAMDMMTQLMYKPTNLLIVKALAVMTVYAQGLSSPQRLEYTFCAMASQAAQGLGLHRQPLRSWHLSEAETQERNRLFWVVYALDKTISLRCGRPSPIDDDEISCAFPHGTSVMQNSMADAAGHVGQEGKQAQTRFDFFLIYTQYARICGSIAKQLYSAFALSRPFSDLLMTAANLETALDRWRDSIPHNIRPGRWFRSSDMPSDIPLIQALSLNYGYHYAICSVHRRFSAMFGRSAKSDLPLGALKSADTKFLEAARSMVLLTKHLDIESHSPGWLIFYYPVTAIIGVFTSVVCDPQSESGSNDIALMEVIVGHLGRLEFMTSGGTAFNRIGELVRLARIIVQRAHDGTPTATFNGSPETRRDSTTGGLHNVRSIPEETTDLFSHSILQTGHSPSSNRLHTPENLQNPAERDLVGLVQHAPPDHHQRAISLSSLPMIDHSYIEYDDQQRAPALNFQNHQSNLDTEHIFDSFASHAGQFDSACLTDEDVLQWQTQQQNVDNYTSRGVGAMDCSSAEYQHLSGGTMDVGLT